MNRNPFHSQFDPNGDSPFYQTGSTHPPRSLSGILALILGGLILLGGLVVLLGFVKTLLPQKEAVSQPDPASLSFSRQEDPTPEDNRAAPRADSPADVSIQLQEIPQAVENIPQDGGLSLQTIYEKNIPSVVSITSYQDDGTSTGTGLVISEGGFVVTNCHVINDAASIQLLLQDGREYPARLVGADQVSDLAVLYVNAPDLTPAQFGNSATVRVGDLAVAIGDPLGAELRGTMTDGIVSAINRDILVSGRTMTLIQTNAALNAGNSGGPLINCYGQVIGINTMKVGDYMSDAGVEGLGFAIPSATVKEVVDQLIAQGFVSGRPSLGFRCETISSFLQMYYRLPQGLYITEVTPGSAADRAKIAVGDVLLGLDDHRTPDTEVLDSLLHRYDAGDRVTATLSRNGKQYSVELVLDQATG